MDMSWTSRDRPRLFGALPVALVSASLLLAGCGTGSSAAQAPTNGSAAPTACPLTGQARPGGGVPARPALAIKVGNEPPARPQSGLNHADIVFEEPIEGAITRLLAVYQCQTDSRVGPVRSTRWVDSQLLPQFGHPGFGYAGGITPDTNLVSASGIKDLNFITYASAFHRSSTRQAPDNLYADTAALWAYDSSHTLPPAVFSYSTTAPAGRPVGGISLVYSGIYSSGWRWNASGGNWSWYVNSVPQQDANGSPVTATNVVVIDVHTYPGPYVEDALGSHGVRSQTTGSGSAIVLRNGQAITATWSRSGTGRPFRLTDPRTGKVIALAPGRTWVELFPVTATSTLLPAG